MDLESYISKYSGQTRLQRLLLVGSTTADAALSAQAYRLAVQQLKADGNVRKYKEIFRHLGQQGQGQSAAEEQVPSTGEIYWSVCVGVSWLVDSCVSAVAPRKIPTLISYLASF